MLKTGIEPSAASSSSSASGPVRTPTACTCADRIRAVSLTDSPRESCISSGRSTHRVAAELDDRRPRRRAACACSASGRRARRRLPASACEERGAAFSSSARSQQRGEVLARELGTGEQVPRQAREHTASRRRDHARRRAPADAHRPHLEPLPRPRRPRRAACRRRPLRARRSPAGNGTWRCSRSARRGGREPLARASGAHAYRALTSRNQLLPLLRPLAERRPDIVKSWGGGCNAILVRGAPRDRARAPAAAAASRAPRDARGAAGVRRLGRQRPRPGAPPRVGAGRPRPVCSAALLRWSAGAPAILGGDLNLRAPARAGLRPAPAGMCSTTSSCAGSRSSSARARSSAAGSPTTCRWSRRSADAVLGYASGACAATSARSTTSSRPRPSDEVQAAALQYVRKVSGSTKPSQANAAAFDRAVAGGRRRHDASARRARDVGAAEGPRGSRREGAGPRREALRGLCADEAQHRRFDDGPPAPG